MSRPVQFSIDSPSTVTTPRAAPPVIGPGGTSSTTTTYGNTTTGVPGVVALSTLIQPNDLLILAVSILNVAAGGPGCTAGPPARAGTPTGWTPLNQPIPNIAGHMWALFTRTALAGDAGGTVSVPWNCAGIGDYALTVRVLRGGGAVAPTIAAFADAVTTNATNLPSPALNGLTGASTLIAWWTDSHSFFARPLTLPAVLGDQVNVGGNGSSQVIWAGSGTLTVTGNAPSLTPGAASTAEDNIDAFALAVQY